MKKKFRLICLISLVLVCWMLGVAAYLQEYAHVNPCPLCILQRFALIILGIVFLIGVLIPVRRWSSLIVSGVAYFIALGGALLAGRQIWLQHLPPNQTEDCGASLEYMMKMLPWQQVFQKVLTGSAECSLVDWRFWSMSLAEWSLICFMAYLVITGWLFFSSWRARSGSR